MDTHGPDLNPTRVGPLTYPDPSRGGRRPWAGRLENGRLGLWILPFLLGPTAVLASPVPQIAQNCSEPEVKALPGVAFPSTNSRLHDAHASYLGAWNAVAPGELLELLAPEARGLVRNRLLDVEELKAFLRLVQPELTIGSCSVFLVEDVGEWVSVGTYVQVGARGEASGQATGTIMTVWEEGPDGGWQVVFLSALWLGVEESPPTTVAGGRTGL